MRILLVEDDIPLAEGLKQSLHRENYAVDWVETGSYALNAVRGGDVELMILDLGLPDMDGLDVLKKAKEYKADLPVLVLTARDGIDSKVMGLDLGAEDYLAKPFDIAELLARMRVIERRLGTGKSSLIFVGDIRLDLKANLIFDNNEEINLSRKEYMIAKALIENAGRIQSKTQLETKLYEWGEEISSNAIEVHVHNIRKKFPKDFVQTVRGVGYIVRPTLKT
ncbi:response regulator [Glaciecola sp. XM2]|uniref:response regulator n=1 Tax=Glaciecola sp. XM2 TaxID=1914931 RepID=UPI001BDEC421|nr:response regulator [Glaciecola sp. XM2]MBT1449300.1 response regulator [Glaciecola sp. XM2]